MSKSAVSSAGIRYAMRGVLLSLCIGTGLAAAHQDAAKRNLRSLKSTQKTHGEAVSPLAFQVIGLSRKPSVSPLRTTFGNKRLYHFSGSDGTPDKAGAEVLTQFTPELPAYFAQLDFEGQLIDVLVDTGSSNLLIPAATQCEDCDDSIVTQRLNLTTAGAHLVACEDSFCKGGCTAEALEQAGIVDLTCGPHGGVCSLAERFSDAVELNMKNGGSRDATQNLCLFYDGYGDGSHAAGFVVESKVDLAGNKVTAKFGAITGASDGFYEAPQGGGIMGLAFPGEMDCNAFSCFPSLYNTLVSAPASGVKDVFAICGGNTEEASGEAAARSISPVLLIGGGDSRLFKGKLTYVPMVEPFNFYRVDAVDVKVGDGASAASLKGGRKLPSVIVDTGTSGVIVPSYVYANFKAHVQTHYCHIPYVCAGEPSDRTIFDDICVSDPEHVFAALPSLHVVLSEKDKFALELSPRQYMQQVSDETGTAFYCFALAGGLPISDGEDELFLIGEVLLNKYYLEFDRVKRRMGFATSVADCAGSLKQ